MSVFNDGRNDNRIPNSNSRCLLENWFEERKTCEIEHWDLLEYTKSRAVLLKDGHQRLILPDPDAPFQDVSVTKDHYKIVVPYKARTVGVKKEKMDYFLKEKYMKEVMDRNYIPPEPADYSTTTGLAFGLPDLEDKIGQLPPSQERHDYTREESKSFWTEHRDVIWGVSRKKPGYPGFGRNSCFTDPTNDDWDWQHSNDLRDKRH